MSHNIVHSSALLLQILLSSFKARMTLIPSEQDPLLGNKEVKIAGTGEESDDDHDFVPLKDRAWSFSHSRRQVATAGTSPVPGRRKSVAVEASVENSTNTPVVPDGSRGGKHYIFCLIYAVVNVIIAVPSLFGYAAVIFNHPIFSSHMNALSKRKKMRVE